MRVMYQKILQGIRLSWPGLAIDDLAFFEVHARIDDDHAEALRGIATTLAETRAGRSSLAVGALQSLGARANFFEQMLTYLREEDSPVGEQAA